MPHPSHFNKIDWQNLQVSKRTLAKLEIESCQTKQMTYPHQDKKIGSPEHLVGSFTSLLIFCIAFQFLGPCSKKRGSKRSKKCTFQIYHICASNGGQGTKQMFISPFWGDVGVKKLSPLLRSVTSDDVGQKCQFSGRSVLHRISSNMCPDADNFLKHS